MIVLNQVNKATVIYVPLANHPRFVLGVFRSRAMLVHKNELKTHFLLKK